MEAMTSELPSGCGLLKGGIIESSFISQAPQEIHQTL
jgi:hypothetical protein